MFEEEDWFLPDERSDREPVLAQYIYNLLTVTPCGSTRA